MTQPEDTKTRLLREFEEWADATTAEFQSDGEDERNVSFKELAFFDELKKYFSTALDTVEREAKNVLDEDDIDNMSFEAGQANERARVKEAVEKIKGFADLEIRNGAWLIEVQDVLALLQPEEKL